MPHTYRFQIGALVGFGIMAIVSIDLLQIKLPQLS
jgi:hypothetical protein